LLRLVDGNTTVRKLRKSELARGRSFSGAFEYG